MSALTREPGGTAVELPAGAPLIRLTAGAGSAGQKTWNIRRPVTLIGSCRPAQIVLHDQDVSKAHCVIVNTGKEVLVKDLRTTLGTFRKNERVDLALLEDGDVLTIGKTKIQVAIRTPENDNDDSGCGVEFVDPTRFPQPVTIVLDHTDQQWQIEDAVSLIGRHAGAEIRVDHPEVSARHAILFKFANAPAVFDLGGRSGIGVNGKRCPIAALQNEDRIAVGACTLSVHCFDSPFAGLGDIDSSGVAEPSERATDDAAGITLDPQEPKAVGGRAAREGEHPEVERTSPLQAISDYLASSKLSGDSSAVLAKIESELGSLQQGIQSSWERVNAWELRLSEDASKLDKQEMSLSAREEELDAKDAALRGRLHDLTRFHEQITEREKELAEQLAKIQDDQDRLTKADAELAEREAQLSRRIDELRSREHVLAQRWARLQASNCPHCGKPMRTQATTPAAK